MALHKPALCCDDRAGLLSEVQGTQRYERPPLCHAQERASRPTWHVSRVFSPDGPHREGLMPRYGPPKGDRWGVKSGSRAAPKRQKETNGLNKVSSSVMSSATTHSRHEEWPARPSGLVLRFSRGHEPPTSLTSLPSPLRQSRRLKLVTAMRDRGGGPGSPRWSQRSKFWMLQRVVDLPGPSVIASHPTLLVSGIRDRARRSHG